MHVHQQSIVHAGALHKSDLARVPPQHFVERRANRHRGRNNSPPLRVMVRGEDGAGRTVEGEAMVVQVSRVGWYTMGGRPLVVCSSLV
jgi:hypothetical protein